VFADRYNLDLPGLLNGLVFDWTGKEAVRDYMESLLALLAPVLPLFQATYTGSLGFTNALTHLASYYKTDMQTGEVRADEAAVFNLAKLVEKKGAAALVPTVTK
jgi:hypothetical protein